MQETQVQSLSQEDPLEEKMATHSSKVSRGSAGEYQADERAGVARLCWQVSGRWEGRCRAAPLGESVLTEVLISTA